MKLSKRQIDLLGHLYHGRAASMRGNVVTTSSGQNMGPASVAKALEERGYITIRYRGDLRYSVLEITEEGKAVYEEQ
jgi:hypothetical protein